LGDHGMLLRVAAAGDGSTEDTLVALALVPGLRTHLDTVERALIEKAREGGASWARIAAALGLASRQAAEQRYLRLRAETARVPAPARRTGARAGRHPRPARSSTNR